jgi:PAS domain S-box-containing protein
MPLAVISRIFGGSLHGGPLPLSSFLRRLIWLCMLPLVALAALLGLQQVRLTMAESERAAQQRLQSAVLTLDLKLTHRLRMLEVLAQSPELDEPRHLPGYGAQAMAFRSRMGSEIILADREGQMLAHTALPPGSALPKVPRSKGRSALLQVLDSKQSAVGDVVFGPVAKQALVALAAPVLRADRITAVLLTVLDQASFDHLLPTDQLPQGWVLSIQDSLGQSITQRGKVTSAPHAEARRFVAVSTVAPWQVALSIPVQQFEAPLRSGAWKVTALLLAVTGIGALGGTLASRRLARAVSGLSQGDTEAEGNDTVEEVAAARRLLKENQAARAMAQAALEASQRTFQALFDGMPDAIVFADPTRHIRFVNPAFTAQYGYRADEVAGRTTEFLYADPADYQRLGRERFNMQAQSDPSPFEMRFRRQDGSLIWVETSGMRIVGPDGAVMGMLGVHRDISERKRQAEVREQAAQQLQELHERFAVVFRDSPIAIVIGRLSDGVVLDANPAAEALYGYSREELLGSTGRQLRIWLDEGALRQANQEMDERGQVGPLEIQCRRQNGDIVDVAFSSRRVMVGGQSHFFSLTSDITAQKQAQLELEAHRARLEDMVRVRTAALATANGELAERTRVITELYDGAPCGYVSLRMDGTVVECNATVLRQLGQTRENIIGHSVIEFMTLDSALRHRQHARHLLNGGQARGLEYDFVRPDGSHFAALLDADFERDENGKAVSARATLVDDSVRRARDAQISDMQQELAHRADQAEAATRAKSAFLANMSHEIRTPLNAIIGLTHLMSKDSTDARQRDRLGKVAASGQHLLQVINDVLDLSKIEAGKMVLHPADFDLDKLLAGVQAMVAEAARDKGLTLLMHSPGVPKDWHGDATRLSQALLNLVANAVKFTSRGQVRVQVQVLVRDAAQRALLRFEVQDTGEGISNERQQALFSAFEQADNSMTRRHGGTGLGLALTRHLAKLMGGEAGVRSALGAGSTFWFTAWLQVGVPAIDDASPSSWAPESGDSEALLRARHAGKRVLLAEDNPVNQEVASAVLEAAGLVVDVVGDGAQAVAAVQARNYDLVLMDMQMPVLDGLGAARCIRGSLTARVGIAPRLPIIAMTANAFSEDRSACLAAGMDDHIAKPIDAARLYATLLRWLSVSA